jgi:hypothetical protein
MKHRNVDSIRRKLLIGGVAVVAGAPLLRNTLISPAQAKDLVKLTEDDPMAKALKYHRDATQAPRAEKAGTAADKQFCKNCKLIRADSGEWRPCQIFPGKLVHETGWCNSWLPQ